MLEQTQTSTWQSKLKALGPGILMASAAVGGSHIVSSAQAGAKYGWALMGLVILANLFASVLSTPQKLVTAQLKAMPKKEKSTWASSSF